MTPEPDALTEAEVAEARRDTPGCEGVVHLNNAGASLAPQPVLDAVVGHLELEARRGGYEAAAQRADAVANVYAAVGRLIGCAPSEVAIVENATRAWDMAVYAFHLRPGDRLLTGRAEYASNYLALKHLADTTGARVEVVPDDEHGAFDVDALAPMLDERVRLVSLVHVPTQGGLVNPAARVGAVTRAAGVPLVLDACQSAGQMPLDVEELGCDVLTTTGRKFLRGPRGTGVLYVRREILERLHPPFVDLHAAEWLPDGGYRLHADGRRFETWETNYATKIGLGVAIDYALGWGIARIRDRSWALAAALREALAAVPGVTLRDQGIERCAIVTFDIAGRPAADVVRRCVADGFNVSLSLGAYSRLDYDARGIDALVRASPHYYNTVDEIERFVGHIARLAP